MYKLFLCSRYLFKRRIAFFAVGAVMLCTAMVLIVISVMGGFLDMVKERSRGLLADLIVDNQSLQGFPYYQELIDTLQDKMPETISAATPVVYNYGTLRFPDNITKPVYIVGIRLEETYAVNEFKESLYYNKHYPGSTTLAEQQQPVFGFDEELIPRLPEDLEAKLRQAQANSTAGEEEATPDLPREKGMMFPGPGYFASPIFLAVVRSERLQTSLLTFAEDLAGELEKPPDERDLEFIRDQTRDLRDEARRIRELFVPQELGEELLQPLSDLAEVLDEFPALIEKNDPEPIAQALEVMDRAISFQVGLLRSRLDPGYVGRALPGIIIGRDMIGDALEGSAYDRWYPRGERVFITVPAFTRKGTLASGTPISKALRYVDDSRYGVFEIDSRNVYVDFELAQQLLGVGEMRLSEELGGGLSPSRATQVQIKLADGVDIEAARDRVEEVWFGMIQKIAADMPSGVTDDDIQLMSQARIETWQARQQVYIQAVEKEKGLMIILFAIISLVAVLLVGCIFYMIVQEKTRDIGIIKSMGATAQGVASIFISYGFLVGVVGSALGLIFGVLFVSYINEIQEALAALNPSLRVWSRESYSFDKIPNTVKATEATVIVVVAILSSIVGSLLPAWRAARVWPVESLRYE